MIFEAENTVSPDGIDPSDVWLQLDRVCICAIKLLRLKNVNIGIMKLYNDNSFIELLHSILTVTQKTPIVSLQCFPDTISHLAEFINRLLVFYSEEIVQSDAVPYILSFVKSLFLSSQPIDIDYACSILLIFARFDIEAIRPHFILAFNYMRNKVQITQFILNFIFFMIDNDRDFFNSVINIIVEFAGENGEQVHEILNLLTQEENSVLRYQNFVGSLIDFPILIDEVPSLSPDFVFSE